MSSRWPLSAALLLLLVLAVSAASPNPENDSCLACHGQKDGGKFVDGAAFAGSRHGALSCASCHADIKEYPHPGKVRRVDCGSCHAEPAAAFKTGVHAKALAKGNACAACHGTHAVQSPGRQGLSLCASCHAQPAKDYALSVHGRSRAHGDIDAATCFSCHGGGHSIRAVKDSSSTVNAANLPKTCAQCHSDPQLAARHALAPRDMYKLYMRSTHGRANGRGSAVAANCASCHGHHQILATSDPRSSVSGGHIADTCGRCHGEQARVFKASVHGAALARGERAAPTCVDCHGEHDITGPLSAGSRVAPGARAKTCSDCHASERIASRLGLPAEKIASFQNSFHGMAGRGGAVKVADCASCHGSHDVRPSSDPKSSVHPTNLAATCGSCHPGAGKRWGVSGLKVHESLSREGGGSRIAAFFAAFYGLIIPLTAAGMIGHNLLDLWRKSARPHRTRHREAEQPLSLWERWQHASNAFSFLLLAYSGFALQHHEAWWAGPIRALGGEAARRNAHRAAAALFVLTAAAHLSYLAGPKGRLRLRAMLPAWRDLTDALSLNLYNAGLAARPPKLMQFSYIEKFEYWALLWGSIVMTATGSLLLFHNLTLAYFPLWVTETARVIHYLEAVLAALAILIWHGYWVIFDPEVYPMNWAWLTGRTSRAAPNGEQDK